MLWNWLQRRWHAQQRRIDMDILWPACLREARDLDHAKAAFARHCMHDEAWLALGENAIIELIDDLRNDGK
jgi:hypothetical protein